MGFSLSVNRINTRLATHWSSQTRDEPQPTTPPFRHPLSRTSHAHIVHTYGWLIHSNHMCETILLCLPFGGHKYFARFLMPICLLNHGLSDNRIFTPLFHVPSFVSVRRQRNTTHGARCSPLAQTSEIASCVFLCLLLWHASRLGARPIRASLSLRLSARRYHNNIKTNRPKNKWAYRLFLGFARREYNAAPALLSILNLHERGRRAFNQIKN